MHRTMKIPAPWGHIAAKEWGNSGSGTKVIAVHGWQDNANSFDPLVSHMPSGKSTSFSTS